MSQFPCCEPAGTKGGNGDPVVHTIINIGGFAEWYVIGTGPNPFELRTAQSSDGSVGIVQNLTNLDFTVSVRNVGTFAEVYVIGTVLPFDLRTFQSSDGSVSVVQNLLDIDLTVVAPPFTPTKVFQEDDNSTLLTDSDTFLTLATLPGDPKVLDGEEWKINMCVLVCVPHGLGSTSTNSEVKWSIETAAGVFTEFDRYSSRDQLAISGGQKSQPMHRTKKLTAAFDTPRMLVEVRRTTVGNADFFWEDPRWGGVIITPAPP